MSHHFWAGLRDVGRWHWLAEEASRLRDVCYNFTGYRELRTVENERWDLEERGGLC